MGVDRSLFVTPVEEVPFDLIGSPFGEDTRNVAMNNAGTVVAVGSYAFGANDAQVLVFDYDVSQKMWIQRGLAIDIPEATDSRPNEILVSENGQILVTSFQETAVPNSLLGTVRLFAYASNQWELTADALSIGEQGVIGSPVDMKNGILAVGKKGRAQIYQFDAIAKTFTTAAPDIVQPHQADRNVEFVSMDDTASTLALGIPHFGQTSGQQHFVRIYHREATGSYTLRDELPPISADAYDCSAMVSLNANGNILGVGSWNLQGNQYDSSVQVYQYVGNEWSPSGRTVDLEPGAFPLYTMVLNDVGDRMLTSRLGAATLYSFEGTAWVPLAQTVQDTLSAAISSGGNVFAVSTQVNHQVSVFRESDDRQDGNAPVTFAPSCTEPVPYGYRFFSQKDSAYRSYGLEDASQGAEYLARQCDANAECKGFNSLGLMKVDIRPLDELETKFEDVCDGLFVKLSCVPVPHSDACSEPVPCGYDFIPQKHMQYYIYDILPRSDDLYVYADACDNDPKCAAFDSYGVMKLKVDESQMYTRSSDPCIGTYAKKPTSTA